VWPDIGSRFAPVKLVHRSGDLPQIKGIIIIIIIQALFLMGGG
jgi:hypothetical protein